MFRCLSLLTQPSVTLSDTLNEYRIPTARQSLTPPLVPSLYVTSLTGALSTLDWEGDEPLLRNDTLPPLQNWSSRGVTGWTRRNPIRSHPYRRPRTGHRRVPETEFPSGPPSTVPPYAHSNPPPPSANRVVEGRVHLKPDRHREYPTHRRGQSEWKEEWGERSKEVQTPEGTKLRDRWWNPKEIWSGWDTFS